MVQVTFVIDLETFSTVIRSVPLLWHVQTFKLLAKVEVDSTGKQLASMPGSDAVA
jgi:hypothetical protein